MTMILVIMVVFGAISGGGVGSRKVSAAIDFSGEGSFSKPYLIGTANQLNKVRGSYLDGNLYFQLTGPIDLSSYAAPGWVPIGNQDTPFKGHMDGNGYQITGLTIHNGDFSGLFGSIGNGSSVANMKLENVSIHSGYAVAALVGLNDGGTIENSFATGSVSGDYSVGGLTGSNNNGEIKDSYAAVDVSGSENVGGLVGDSNSGIISGSHAAGIVSGNKYVGGLVGYKSDGTISGSYASGNVSLVASTDRNAGGLVGYNENGTIRDSYASGKVSGGEVIGGLLGSSRSGTISDSYAIGDVSGSFVAGGLVGNASYGKITNSYAAGNVSLLPNPAVAYGSPYAGGLAATNNNGEISGSYATGNVSGTDESYSIGGLIGKNDNSQGGNILNSYATGHVNGGNSSFQVGGLIGFSTSGTISYSYATGNVNLSGSDLSTQVGGLVGDNNGGTISHSFATGEVGGRYEVGGLVGTNYNYESGEVKSSYASGQVSGSADSEYVGGLVGRNRYGFINDSYASGQVAGNEKVGGLTGQNGGGMINNSYATGKVSGSIDAGGLVGERLDSHLGGGGVATNSFYDTMTTAQSVSAGGLGQSTVQMQAKSTYEADSAHIWDFANVWTIDALHNNGYPYLSAIQVYLDYDGNGSTSGTVPTSHSFMQGVKADVYSGMINLIKPGHVFNGWNTQADGNGVSYKPGDSFAIAVNTILYAKWIVPNSNATLTSTIGNVSIGGTTSESITDIPYGTTLAAFKAAITPAADAVFEVYDADGVTAATRLATGKKVIVTATDGTTKTTYTVNVKANDANEFLSFGLPEQTGSAIIDAVAHTVEIEVMSGASVNNLVATFVLSAEATVKVGTIDQASGTTVNDFTNPVTYVVKAENGTVQNWKVTVTVAVGTENEITAFSLTQQTGQAVIDATDHTVAIQVANGTSLTNLKAVFTLSAGATAKVGTTDQVSGTTANNFTNPVVYVVKAQNGITQNWTVTVTAAFSSAKAITAFSFPQQTGPAVIDATAHTVVIQVVYGTNVTSLKAVFTLSPGAFAKVGSRGQTSNSTVNNFTNPVTYLVRAADDSTQNWIVTVNVAAASSVKDLTAFSFQGLSPAVVGTINGANIALTVPNGTAVSSLVATFTSSAGSTVKVGSTAQVSGTTANDFTSPVTYMVTAQDGTMASYTVVVTRSAAPAGNPSLSGLTLSSGGLTLIPDSVTGTTYHFNVTNPISSMNVTASVYDRNSAILGSLYNNGNVLVVGPFNLTTGQATQSLPLDIGNNRMELVITALDGSSKTYLVYVNRAAAVYSNGGGGGSGPSNVGTIWAARGGTLILNGVQIDVPLGAVDTDTQVTVNKISGTSSLPSDNSMGLASEIYEITKDKAGDFIKAVVITLPFDKAKIDFSKSSAALYGLNEHNQKWELLDDQKIDQTQGTVSGSIRHFTKFAVLVTDKKTTTNPPVEVVNFGDIKGHWAETSIRDSIQLGIIDGYSDHTFKPNNQITRAEFVTMIVKAFHLQAQTGKAFGDTQAHWARNAIEIAAALGVVTGYSASAFGPDDLITREQMAVIAIRAAQITAAGDRIDSFKDNAEISDWARAALAAATAKALFNGYEDGTLKPKANTTRAEAVTIILRAIQLKK
ncbi:S-layer homology domain-containing protein [Paenibacillus sp. HWE-109]|uniref:GLUG motif-containing protein n=1 Tax=Paenibacillus sp. HWE-109 TaxID=1306526 RepID=UPI001EE14941|nr:GLUG motif-containing protein [Paenibacillus sp. HWE-109]UKS24997.1 S-layer homology domain-containing protein [Paenibacillus sp. HWE-109]